MRWPFGPPHLTLKPSKENTKTQKQTKKNKKKETKRKTAKIPKNSFSVISQFCPFFGWLSKFPFFTPWPKKPEPKKTIKIGVLGPFFWKAVVHHETAIFGPKNPKFINFSYHFFCLFSSLSKTKITKICWNPYFYSVFANLKKENFQKINLKHWKLKKPNFAPLFWKRLFLENWKNNWKKHKLITEHPKNHLKPRI